MIEHMIQHTDQYDILIVDDTPDSLELLSRILKERGYRVRPTTSGRHALKSVAAKLPDLILLDVKMPDIDGYAVCRRIKSNEHSRNVPVIFISAHGKTAQKVEGFTAGGVDYITKPFQAEEVLARVKTHLRLHKLTNRLDQEVRERTEELATTNQQLLASEQLFRALVENSPDFIARYDREFRRIYVNPSIQKLFKGQAQQVIGKTPADGSPLYAPQVYLDHLRQALETGTESSAEIPFRTARGEMHWGHNRFVPEFGSDGHVLSVLAIGRDIHEIKENEQRFRMLAENFPDFVVRFDRDGHYTYVNPAVEKAFGLSADAIVGKALHELSLSSRPEQNDERLAQIRRAFDEGVANEFESHWNTELGERIFEIRHAPEKDAAGNVVSVLGIARDISERKQMEQERVATLRFFENLDQINRAIQENSDLEQMMSDVLDLLLSALDCDRASLIYPCDPKAAMWKVRMEQTKPQWPGAFALGRKVPMEPGVAMVSKTVLASTIPVGFGPENEHPLPPDVAVKFDVQSQLAMAISPKADKPYMLLIHQCSRPRVWAQKEKQLFKEIGRRLEDALASLLMYRKLIDSEQRYRMVFENSPVSIWEEDFSAVKALFDDLKKQGVDDIEAYFDRHPETVQHCAALAKIVDVNRAALALHGAADKQELLAGMVRTFTPESYDAFRRELVCLWNAETAMTADAVVKTLAGERRDVTVYFSVCPGHEQTLSKVVVSLIDITDRRQAEQKIALYRDNLEEMVRARTAQLEAANKELEAFSYSVSHDLRAPLRHINGFLELLQKKAGNALDEQSRHYMGIISDAAIKMGRLIDELLSFSRMGRHTLSFQRVALDQLVRDILREFKPDTAGRAIVWRIGDLPAVNGDTSMLRIVLVNLIANALKFTRPRQQTIIEIGSQPGKHSEAEIFVRDNGVGFDMTYADKLFGVFQRLHHSDEFEGTGIGLASVRRIIARHGGRTWAEGEINQGAVFYFSLPQEVQSLQGE